MENEEVKKLKAEVEEGPGNGEEPKASMAFIHGSVENGIFEQVLLEYIFENLDIQRLKICRLVSKRWNEEACRLLRKRSVTYVTKLRSRFPPLRHLAEDFLRVLQSKDPKLPSPFKSLDICAKFITRSRYSCIEDILRQVRQAEVVSLKVETNFNLFPDFKMHNLTLTQLNVDSEYDFVLPAKVTSLYFPVLESFTFPVRSNFDCIRTNSITRVIEAAPKLNAIKIHFDGFTDCSIYFYTMIFPQLQTLDNFVKIQNLNFGRVAPVAFDAVVKGLKCFQNLRSFVIDNCSAPLEEVKTRALFHSIRSISATIAHLDFYQLPPNENTTTAEFPYCPNLQSLRAKKLNLKLNFAEVFPSLKSVAFYDVCNGENLCPDHIASHERLSSIEIITSGNGRITAIFSKMPVLRKLFPNCKSLNVSVLFASRYCSLFHDKPDARSGWDLDTLILSHYSTPSSCRDRMYELLVGASKDPGVRDLKGLRSLVVNRYEITNSMIKRGLSSLNNVDTVKIEWNDKISVDLFVKSLGHLKVIVVLNCCDARYSQQMELLFTQLTCLRCECSTKSH